MNNNDDAEKQQEIELNLKLIKMIDDLLASCDWDSTLLLRTAKKKYLDIRERAVALQKELTGEDLSQAAKNQEIVVPAGYVKVFISLYQTQGSNMQIWHSVLKSLPNYGVTRQVYRDEAKIRELIRAKTDPMRHGYAIVLVKESDILPNHHQRKDQLGNELLTLRDNAILAENIVEFVYANKHYYRYKDGKLILKDLGSRI